ncbi:MAG: hypothetical protein ACI4Q9_03390 [Candidatus Methanomethylophilaceae archaeon]
MRTDARDKIMVMALGLMVVMIVVYYTYLLLRFDAIEESMYLLVSYVISFAVGMYLLLCPKKNISVAVTLVLLADVIGTLLAFGVEFNGVDDTTFMLDLLSLVIACGTLLFLALYHLGVRRNARRLGVMILAQVAIMLLQFLYAWHCLRSFAITFIYYGDSLFQMVMYVLMYVMVSDRRMSDRSYSAKIRTAAESIYMELDGGMLAYMSAADLAILSGDSPGEWTESKDPSVDKETHLTLYVDHGKHDILLQRMRDGSGIRAMMYDCRFDSVLHSTSFRPSSVVQVGHGYGRRLMRIYGDNGFFMNVYEDEPDLFIESSQSSSGTL